MYEYVQGSFDQSKNLTPLFSQRRCFPTPVTFQNLLLNSLFFTFFWPLLINFYSFNFISCWLSCFSFHIFLVFYSLFRRFSTKWHRLKFPTPALGGGVFWNINTPYSREPKSGFLLYIYGHPCYTNGTVPAAYVSNIAITVAMLLHIFLYFSLFLSLTPILILEIRKGSWFFFCFT